LTTFGIFSNMNHLQLKLSTIATSISLISISLIPTAAFAVPGWGQTFRDLRVPASGCKNSVEKAIRKVTGSAGTTNQVNGTTYMMTTYPQGTTGVFIYCASNPELACGQRTSTVMIVAFSDRGSGEAVNWNDRLNRAIGSPEYIDCG
jgi:hypothetical protein